MAIIKCPECNKDASSKASTCPNCGYKIARHQLHMKLNFHRKKILGISIFLILTLVISFILIEDSIRKKELKESLSYSSQEEIIESIDYICEYINELNHFKNNMLEDTKEDRSEYFKKIHKIKRSCLLFCQELLQHERYLTEESLIKVKLYSQSKLSIEDKELVEQVCNDFDIEEKNIIFDWLGIN